MQYICCAVAVLWVLYNLICRSSPLCQGYELGNVWNFMDFGHVPFNFPNVLSSMPYSVGMEGAARKRDPAMVGCPSQVWMTSLRASPRCRALPKAWTWQLLGWHCGDLAGVLIKHAENNGGPTARMDAQLHNLIFSGCSSLFSRRT